MNPAMTLPSTSSPPTIAHPTDRASDAAASGEHGRVPPKSFHRPRFKQLRAVTQLPSHPPPPPGPAHPGEQPKRMSRSEREEAAKITQPCSECGKRFWSWKALFGHMRCHPDRPWRGIDPPPDCPRRGSELVGPLADHPPASEGGASDAEVAAASSLILLKGEETEGSSSTDEPVPPSQASGKFRCSSCDRTFDTPNGLGGHRAGHARSMRDAAARKRKASEDGAHRAVQLHECGVCSMSFSSGQALGGHMSSHWKGECELRVAAAAAAAEAASSSTSSAGGCRFDLNLPPAEETQDAFFPSAFAIEWDLKLPADGCAP